jgi:hypothetical protein
MTFSTFSVKDRHDKAEENKADERDEQAQHDGRQPHRPIPDAGGAAGDQFVVGRQPAINHRGGKKGGNGQRIRLHRRHEIAEDARDLLGIEAVFGERAQQPAEAHDRRQRYRSEDEDANEVFEDIPEQRAAHGADMMLTGGGEGSMWDAGCCA